MSFYPFNLLYLFIYAPSILCETPLGVFEVTFKSFYYQETIAFILAGFPPIIEIVILNGISTFCWAFYWVRGGNVFSIKRGTKW